LTILITISVNYSHDNAAILVLSSYSRMLWCMWSLELDLDQEVKKLQSKYIQAYVQCTMLNHRQKTKQQTVPVKKGKKHIAVCSSQQFWNFSEYLLPESLLWEKKRSCPSAHCPTGIMTLLHMLPFSLSSYGITPLSILIGPFFDCLNGFQPNFFLSWGNTYS
jgi:hypothetical protein